MTATLVTLDDSVPRQRVGIHDAELVHRQLADVHAGLGRGPGRLAHGRVLHGRAQDDGLALLLPGRLGRPEHGQVGGLGATGGEDDLAGIPAEEGGHLVARLLEQAPRPLGGRMTARRVPEPAGADVDLGHGGGHLGPQRGGGGVVQVGDRAQRQPVTAM